MHWPVVAQPRSSAAERITRHPGSRAYAQALPAAHTGRAAMTGERILLQVMARVARSLRAAIGATIIGASVLAGAARADQGAAQSGSGTAAGGAPGPTPDAVALRRGDGNTTGHA